MPAVCYVFQVHFGDAKVDVYVQLHSYLNPRSHDSNGEDCDYVYFFTTSTKTCENGFEFCLQSTSSSDNDCPYGKKSTGKKFIENDNFEFTTNIVSDLGIQNPLVFSDLPPEVSHKSTYSHTMTMVQVGISRELVVSQT